MIFLSIPWKSNMNALSMLKLVNLCQNIEHLITLNFIWFLMCFKYIQGKYHLK